MNANFIAPRPLPVHKTLLIASLLHDILISVSFLCSNLLPATSSFLQYHFDHFIDKSLQNGSYTFLADGETSMFYSSQF